GDYEYIYFEPPAVAIAAAQRGLHAFKRQRIGTSYERAAVPGGDRTGVAAWFRALRPDEQSGLARRSAPHGVSPVALQVRGQDAQRQEVRRGTRMRRCVRHAARPAGRMPRDGMRLRPTVSE